jgi:hypothetical protein
MVMPPEDWMTSLYETVEIKPPQPLAETVKDEVAAVVGVPERFRDVVVLDTFLVMPAGSDPEVIAQE